MNAKWIWISLPLILMLTLNSFAQNTEVKKGINSYESGDYEKALQYFQIALNEEEQLKGNRAAEAYLYRAKTRTALLQQAAQSGEEDAITAHQDALILAFQDLTAAAKKNTNSKFAKTIENEQTILYTGLLQGGAGFLQTVYQNPALAPESKEKLLDAAQRYLSAAKNLKAERYPAYNWYGQVMMLKRDNESAQKHFELAIEKYQTSPPSKADLEHFNVYANLALLAMQKRDAKKALDLLLEGKSALNTAYAEAKKDKKQDLQLLQQQFERLANDFQQLELDIYLHSPEYKEKAIKLFQEALAKDPDNFKLQMAYAKVLEDNNQIEAAIQHYQKASQLSPNNFIPHYNIGVIYLKEAAKLQESISKEATKEEIQALKEKYQASLKSLERAHELETKDAEILQALILVTSRLEMKEAYLNYRKLKKALQ